MKPIIEKTRFGSITISGKKFNHDVIIRLDGQVKKRKKKLSKAVFGTSHIISLAEAQYVYQEGADRIVVGSGQNGMAKLSDEAAEFFEARNCQVELLPTPQALHCWNEAQGAIIALFHVTC